VSLGVVFKGPEGIVLAADSRVTLNIELQRGNQSVVLPSTFDNATKLLRVAGQDYVGVVTYGLGSIGEPAPRTAHSFIPELEEELKGNARLKVEEFADSFSRFFVRQWDEMMPKKYKGAEMVFLIGGYDQDEPYGRVFELSIPSNSNPVERITADEGQFGARWGGQIEYVTRLINGCDPRLLGALQKVLKLSNEQVAEAQKLLPQFGVKIPWQFLPLQDCVDLAIFMIRTTMDMQSWSADLRGVGGAIDVAAITRTGGFNPIQIKQIVGEDGPQP
jgi:hypothetical protein